MKCKYYDKCGIDCSGDSEDLNIEDCQTYITIDTLVKAKNLFRDCHYNEQNKRIKYEEKIKSKLAYYKERIHHCSVFTTEYTICDTAITLLEDLLK